MSDHEFRISAIESALKDLHARNARVDVNKAWERSWTRLVGITLIIYITMLLVFSVLGSPRPLFDAVVPTVGFFLSTLSLPYIRKIWEKNLKR